MALFQKDKGAVVADAKTKLKNAQKAQVAAHKVHNEHDQALQGKIAERENAETLRGELQEQLEEANAEEKKAAVSFHPSVSISVLPSLF